LRGTERAIQIGAIFVIWILMIIGVLVFVAVPFVAGLLVDEYDEYANEFWPIVVMLVTPTLLAESLLVIILVLLRRIRVDQMFSIAAHKWVGALSYNAAALSATFLVILVWLSFKNTLPPIIGLTLLIGCFLPLAVSLVTRALLVLLKNATAKSEELEGVV
jgi:hypothetical protein